ncbi:MAG: cation transporting ATPase C-terminal domain-containing protein, partial [Oscillospiraceae bacterium]|nr:cation transporting ATPase C-terminal domain-containing protein [Oscillospiraceae bacterium]
YMKEKPKHRSEPIVSKNMMSQIATGAGWTFILSLFMLLGANWLEEMGVIRMGSGDLEPHAYLHTAYFAFFIFIAVFNAFNARTEKINIFDNIAKNKGFLIVFGIIAVVQVIMAYVGGSILGGYGLVVSEWLLILGMAITIIPVDLIRKAIAKAVSKK